MKKDNMLGAKIENEEIKKLRDFFMFYLDSTDDEGKVDLNKIINNATYNMGEAGLQLCGVIFQEKLKLRSFEEIYKKKRSEVYTFISENRLTWQPTQKGVEILVEGDPKLSEVRKQYENQKLYVEFLEQCQEQIRYYPRNAKDIVDMAKYGTETGLLRPV
jgi:hypothetical protein